MNGVSRFVQSSQISLEQIDNTGWMYNSDDDVYYQLGIIYCETPADADQEQLSVIVPAEYLLESQEGYGTANVAEYFRINTGIWQSDTAVNTEANLALALTNYGSEVDYSFVWGQEHTMAEESGSSTENFIKWVNDCCAQKSSGESAGS